MLPTRSDGPRRPRRVARQPPLGGPRGGKQTVGDIAIWAVPFGLVGGRLYHVITSLDAYFGKGGEPIRALYIWEGGLRRRGRAQDRAGPGDRTLGQLVQPGVAAGPQLSHGA